MFNGNIKIEEVFSVSEEREQERTEGSDASSYENDSDDEDYIPDGVVDDFSENEEGNVDDIQDEQDLSVSSDIRWKKRDVVKCNPIFTSRTGPSDEVLALQDPSPVALFLLLLRMDLIEKMVSQTNLYATQMQKPFTPLELKELLRFLAINLLMGIKRLPSYRDYWSSDPDLNDPFISRQMSVKRFTWILSHLHMNDNNLQPKREEPGYDKLYKLRPMISGLSENFLSALHPHENQVVGVSAAKYRARYDLTQCLLKKPNRIGYKMWLRCDESGFVCQFDIDTDKTRAFAEKNLAERIVKNLCTPIFGKGHKLFMDSYITTYNLFVFLETKDIFCCGTVHINRKNLPRRLKDEQKLKRGDFDWSVSSDEVFCIKWKDRGCIHVLSNQDQPIEVLEVNRKERNGTTKKIPCPKAVVAYEKNIGYIDIFDNHKRLYELDRKSTKWWHKVFFHLLDVTVVNAFILYKMRNREEKSLKDFRRQVVTGLIHLGHPDEKPKRKPIVPISIKRHKPFVPPEKRLRHVEHIPVRSTTRRCALCSNKKQPRRTRWMCPTCQVPLCLQSRPENCFQRFHS